MSKLLRYIPDLSNKRQELFTRTTHKYIIMYRYEKYNVIKATRKDIFMKKSTEKELLNAGLTDEEIRIRAEQRRRATRKKRKKLLKSLIIVIIILLIAGLVFSRYLKLKEAEKQAGSLNTYTVSRRDIEEVLSATGTLMPADEYTVSASVRGDILSAPFQEGDDVREGDVLYVVDSSDMDSSLHSREISLKNAKKKYEDLIKDRSKLVTYSEYEGIITKLYVEEGDTVRADQAIADIVDKTTMLIELPFFALDVDNMNIGDKITLCINETNEELSGKISEISPLTDVSSYGVTTRAVTIMVKNPGGITKNTTATGYYSTDITSTDSSNFYYNVEEQILAEYDGKIEKLNISEGQWVYKGTSVLSIDDEDLEDLIEDAADALDTAQRNYDDTIENIDDYTITAPISGTVVEKSFNAGESIDVTSGSKIAAIIYDLSSLTFDMNIDELDIFSIKKGQTVTITTEAYKGREFYGEITKISKVGSTVSGTTVYPVTVTITDKEALDALLPGMNIDAEIIINRSENVIAVPTGAVARGNTVKLIKNTGILPQNAEDEKTTTITDKPDSPNGEQRPVMNNTNNLYGTVPGETEYEIIKVETGISDEDFIEITQGLSEGDIVVVENSQVSSGGLYGMMGMMGQMHGGAMGGMPAGGAMPGGNRSGR